MPAGPLALAPGTVTKPFSSHLACTPQTAHPPTESPTEAQQAAGAEPSRDRLCHHCLTG